MSDTKEVKATQSSTTEYKFSATDVKAAADRVCEKLETLCKPENYTNSKLETVMLGRMREFDPNFQILKMNLGLVPYETLSKITNLWNLVLSKCNYEACEKKAWEEFVAAMDKAHAEETVKFKAQSKEKASEIEELAWRILRELDAARASDTSACFITITTTVTSNDFQSLYQQMASNPEVSYTLLRDIVETWREIANRNWPEEASKKIIHVNNLYIEPFKQANIHIHEQAAKELRGIKEQLQALVEEHKKLSVHMLPRDRMQAVVPIVNGVLTLVGDKLKAIPYSWNKTIHDFLSQCIRSLDTATVDKAVRMQRKIKDIMQEYESKLRTDSVSRLRR